MIAKKKKKILALKKLAKKPKKALNALKNIKKARSIKQPKKNLKKSFSKPKKSNQKKLKIQKAVTKKIVKLVRKPSGAIKKSPPRKKSANKPMPDSSLSGSFFKAKIKVIGIGGGGGSIVSEIGKSLHKATFVVADTDMRAFKKKPGIKYFLFGQELTHGLGTGVNPVLGRQAAESEKERIGQFFADQDIVIFIASLGGGLGSGATQVFAEAAKDFNGITLGIFTLPFKFEGKNKYNIALKSLRQLRKSLNVSITIPNEKIFKVIEANTAITDAFSMVNKSLIESLESLIDLIYSPGIINIDFADLRAILGGMGNLAFLNTAEASGKNRATEVSEHILHNPLYQTNNFTAEKILFNIAGGDNVSLVEVHKISEAISQQNPKAKIIFGISKNVKYKHKIKATLLMTGHSKETKAQLDIVDVKIKPKAVKELPAPVSSKNIVKKKTPAKKKRIFKATRHKKPIGKKASSKGILAPVFSESPFVNSPVEFGFEKNHMVNSYGNVTPKFTETREPSRLTITENSTRPKKTIRRTALEIKKTEELKEQERSVQEKEWEIPAFLRLKK